MHIGTQNLNISLDVCSSEAILAWKSCYFIRRMHIGSKIIMKISIFHLTYAHSKKNQAPASSFISEGRGPEITKNMVRRLPGLGVPKRPPATSRKWRKGRLKKGLVFKMMKCLGSRLDLLHLTKRFKASIWHTCTHSGPVWSPRSGPKSSPKSFPRRTQNPPFRRVKNRWNSYIHSVWG